MKVLWVTYDLPFPLNSGGKLRAYHLLKAIRDRAEVTLFSYFRESEKLIPLGEMRRIVSRVEVFQRRKVWSLGNLVRAAFSAWPLLSVSYFNDVLRRRITEELAAGSYDLVHLEFFGVAWMLPWLKKGGYKVILGNENVEYQIYGKFTERVGNPLLRLLMNYDVWKMKRVERRLWRLADANLAVSSSDLKLMEKAGIKNIFLVANGVDVLGCRLFFKPRAEEIRPRALFVGDLKYIQNETAVRWFLDEVCPLIRKEIRDFKLVVVSSFTPSWAVVYSQCLEVNENADSEFGAFVSLADVFVVPVWVKSGTNIKLLQALATGFPVVSTPAGVSGYDFRDGHDLLVGGNRFEFAEKTIALLRDGELRERLRKSALESVSGYDWNLSGQALLKVYEKVKSS